MGKMIRIGKMSFETKSLLVGALVAMVGLSLPPTQSIFEKMLATVKQCVGGIFKKK